MPIYCGKGKEFGQYGDINLRIDLDDIPTEFITTYQGKRQVRVKLKQSKAPDKNGNTHYLVVDEWEPNKPKKELVQEKYSDEIPF